MRVSADASKEALPKRRMLAFINDQSYIKINHSFYCNEKNLIYVLPNNCYQKRCVGQAEDISRYK